MAKDRQQIIEEFDEAVNMTRKELEDWLQTDESQSDGGGESKGHESSRMIVAQSRPPAGCRSRPPKLSVSSRPYLPVTARCRGGAQVPPPRV